MPEQLKLHVGSKLTAATANRLLSGLNGARIVATISTRTGQDLNRMSKLVSVVTRSRELLTAPVSLRGE